MNNIKILYLKNYYIKICKILSEYKYHIKNLDESFVFNHNDLTNCKNILYDLIKNLNNIYNKEIYTFINKITYIEDFNDKILCHYENNFTYKDIFIDFNKNLQFIFNTYGYSNLLEFLKFYFIEEVSIILNKDTLLFLEEINDIILPISIHIIKNDDNIKDDKNNYFWAKESTFNEKDYLLKKRLLYLKLLNKKYVKVYLIFKIDYYSMCIKTCQLNKPLLYKKKNDLYNQIGDNIEYKFLKSFLRHDYLGNIYTLSTQDYIEIINKKYNIFTQISNCTFINILKNFKEKYTDPNKIFELIQLLLLGSEDNVDIAGIILGLIKEKNFVSKVNVYEFIYNNLTYYQQIKIKKSKSHIKCEINKMKELNIENVDFKKQLVINKNIPTYVKTLVLEKIEEMKSFNNEYYKQLTYVKTILNFPWVSKDSNNKFSNLNKNKHESKKYLSTVNKNLSKLCYGHDDSKKYILQIIGKWISNPSSYGMSLGFVGPPGVGKTLLAKSLSSTLDIPFAQITLGGQNDGELLHGHGYTYSGAQPGMIIKKMVEMGQSRCIIYFDELDKACSKYGSINEITSILIHLTDPNMNKTFQDRFFQGVDFPLSKVIFIFSYNDSSLIDPILLDRIKQIKINPYTLNDKVEICKKYIIPEIENEIKINKKLLFSKKTLEYLINNYTREAGVRNIKRNIEEIFMNLNLDLLLENQICKNNSNKIAINQDIIKNILKDPTVDDNFINETSEVGIINGLFATSNGSGGIIQIQIFCNIMKTNDKYNIKLTGSQGNVMKESVSCALTTSINYLKNNNNLYNIDNIEDYIKTNFSNGFHVHTPDTSTPKDGPSAGCAFTFAFLSRILNKKINNKVAMTGEVDLNGRVTKIGGLEYKLQGAKRAKVSTVFIPTENLKDLEQIKLKYKNLINSKFNVITFSHISEIINKVLL